MIGTIVHYHGLTEGPALTHTVQIRISLRVEAAAIAAATTALGDSA